MTQYKKGQDVIVDLRHVYNVKNISKYAQKLRDLEEPGSVYIIPPFVFEDGKLFVKSTSHPFEVATLLVKNIYLSFGVDSILVLDPPSVESKSFYPLLIETQDIEASPEPSDLKCLPSYDEVCIGGTFDHFHMGHRLLILSALFVTEKRLVVGLTGENLLKNKLYKEYIQSYEERKQSVLDFCKRHKPSVFCDIHELKEVAGPAGWDEKLSAIVVTPETQKSVDFINDIRSKANLRVLDHLEIPLIGSTEEMKAVRDDYKISSSTLRMMKSLEAQKKLN